MVIATLNVKYAGESVFTWYGLFILGDILHCMTTIYLIMKYKPYVQYMCM